MLLTAGAKSARAARVAFRPQQNRRQVSVMASANGKVLKCTGSTQCLLSAVQPGPACIGCCAPCLGVRTRLLLTHALVKHTSSVAMHASAKSFVQCSTLLSKQLTHGCIVLIPDPFVSINTLPCLTSSSCCPVTGPVCIVTGGSRGIGRAIALALGKEGARVSCQALPREQKPATAICVGQ